MSFKRKNINLEIAGLGIIFYSPAFTKGIPVGANYLRSHYMDAAAVQRHIQDGTIVGFGTGSSGSFTLQFKDGYPSDEHIEQSRFRLRLGIRCAGGGICCRDLYDLISWDPECPPDQMLELEDGIYHLTLCSNMPASGRLGDHQIIEVYLAGVSEFPRLATAGIPLLCT